MCGGLWIYDYVCGMWICVCMRGNVDVCVGCVNVCLRVWECGCVGGGVDVCLRLSNVGVDVCVGVC